MTNNENKKSSLVRDTLLRLGVISDNNIEIFSNSTRDNSNLLVYRDTKSKVIFIDEYYVGDEEYVTGQYRNKSILQSPSDGILEDYFDTERRIEKYKQFIINKKICDFGCGSGNFLHTAKKYADLSCGVEIQENFKNELNKSGIKCVSKVDELDDSFDTFFMFHCLEHLPDPSTILKDIHKKLKENKHGRIVVEVPHAKDFLLDNLNLNSFKNFTLWSQHLILHTRESLNAILNDAGFNDIYIESIQRYGISNHLYWLKEHLPGGHKMPLSIFETEELRNSYAAALSKIDANDTLVAVASI